MRQTAMVFMMSRLIYSFDDLKKKMFVNPMKFSIIYRSFCLGSIADRERGKYDQIQKLC